MYIVDQDIYEFTFINKNKYAATPTLFYTKFFDASRLNMQVDTLNKKLLSALRFKALEIIKSVFTPFSETEKNFIKRKYFNYSREEATSLKTTRKRGFDEFKNGHSKFSLWDENTQFGMIYNSGIGLENTNTIFYNKEPNERIKQYFNIPSKAQWEQLLMESYTHCKILSASERSERKFIIARYPKKLNYIMHFHQLILYHIIYIKVL